MAFHLLPKLFERDAWMVPLRAPFGSIRWSWRLQPGIWQEDKIEQRTAQQLRSRFLCGCRANKQGHDSSFKYIFLFSQTSLNACRSWGSIRFYRQRRDEPSFSFLYNNGSSGFRAPRIMENSWTKYPPPDRLLPSRRARFGKRSSRHCFSFITINVTSAYKNITLIIVCIFCSMESLIIDLTESFVVLYFNTYLSEKWWLDRCDFKQIDVLHEAVRTALISPVGTERIIPKNLSL